MRSIWKYSLPVAYSEIEMPKGAEIICLQMQRGEPTIWALVDQGEVTETRMFQFIGTGRSVEFPGSVYIGTIQQGPFVWHLFEVTQ